MLYKKKNTQKIRKYLFKIFYKNKKIIKKKIIIQNKTIKKKYIYKNKKNKKTFFLQIPKLSEIYYPFDLNVRLVKESI